MLGGANHPAEPLIPFDHAAVLWMFAYIAARRIVDYDVLLYLVSARAHCWRQAAKSLQDAFTEAEDPYKLALPVQLLVLLDRRFVVFQNIAGVEPELFNVQTGRIVENILPAFETVSYNLSIPVREEWLRILQDHESAKRTQKGAGRQRYPGIGAAHHPGR
jgi:hypothetical protein